MYFLTVNHRKLFYGAGNEQDNPPAVPSDATGLSLELVGRLTHEGIAGQTDGGAIKFSPRSSPLKLAAWRQKPRAEA